MDVVFDIDTDGFPDAVLERSEEVPVVVDFWAAWCGPCRTLGPLLEEAVTSRGGDVLLAKVDVDANPELSQRFGIRGIPAVKGFRDGDVVAEFTGAVPRTHIEDFLDRLVPSEADRLTDRARDAAPADALELYERALGLEPRHRPAAVGLAELVLEDDPERALQLLKPHRPDPQADAIASRAELVLSADADEDELRRRLAADPADGEAHLLLGRVLAAQQQHEEALAHLLEAVQLGGECREPAREQILDVFTILGDDHELVARYRPELARTLY